MSNCCSRRWLFCWFWFGSVLLFCWLCSGSGGDPSTVYSLRLPAFFSRRCCRILARQASRSAEIFLLHGAAAALSSLLFSASPALLLRPLPPPPRCSLPLP